MRCVAELPSGPGIALSVAVPCNNEEEGIGEPYARVTNVGRDQAGQSYEIVLVNDGSKDATRDQMFRLAQRDRHVVAIDLARSYGHQIALSAALEFSAGRRDRRLCRARRAGERASRPALRDRHLCGSGRRRADLDRGWAGTIAHDAGACSAPCPWTTAGT